MKKPNKSVMIDLSEAPAAKTDPVAAPQPPETAPQQVMTRLAQPPARRKSGVWFFSLLAGLISFVIGLWAWSYAANLLLQYPVIGGVVTAVMVILAVMIAFYALRELAALSRLRRIDRLRVTVGAARNASDLHMAQAAIAALQAFYNGHEAASWGVSRLAERQSDVVDSSALLDLAEVEVMPAMDRAALDQVERATRQVATVTAIVPMALLDVISALTINIRMIRAIAEEYGGRAGTLGSWRLLRAVLAHLVATGALAVGDDLIGSIAGGGLLSKLSRRFGEGVINGALTARIGLAAIDVCRPMPFIALKRPKVSGVIKNALTGLFSG